MLSGWKEIASGLGVSVRTAKTYFYEHGMPVLRLPGGKPVLIESLLEKWLQGIDQKKIKLKSNLPK